MKFIEETEAQARLDEILDEAGRRPILLTSRSVYRLSPTDDDWQRDLKAGFEAGSLVLVDDVDKYDERFRKALFKSVAERNARIFATSRTFDGRLARLWEKALGAANVLRLAPLDQRLEDVREFLRRWLSEHRLTQVANSEISETVDLIASLRLPRGFIDLSALLQHLASKEYVFSQPYPAICGNMLTVHCEYRHFHTRPKARS